MTPRKPPSKPVAGSPPALPGFALLVGDDIISREAARDRILGQAHDKHGDVTVSAFDPSVESLSSFLSRFITVSLFPEARVSQIRHADLLTESEITELTGYLDHDIPESYLIIECDFSDGSSSKGKAARIGLLVKAFKKKSKASPERYSFEEFPKPRDWEIPGWIVQNTPRLLHRTITARNAEILADLVGNDLGTLHSELQKIDVHLPEGQAIERKDIEHICGSSREMAPFELAQALGRKDLPRALEIVDGLYTSGFSAPQLVGAVFRHFWALSRIRAFAEACPDDMKRFLAAVKGFNKAVQEEVGVKIGVAAGLFTAEQRNRIYPVLIKQDIINQARGFKNEHMTKVFRWLHEFDIGAKTGKETGSKETVQLLCYKIARVAEG